MDEATLRRMGHAEFAELRRQVGEETIRRNAGLADGGGNTPPSRGHRAGAGLGRTEWAIPMGGQVGLDTASSASRQHRIDTGEYLRHGEAYDA